MKGNVGETVRRYDLDWLRVFAILAVFFYHSTRFFDPWVWHVKNPVTYAWVAWLQGLVAQWMMPLIFVISGASVFYAARKGGAGRFLKDKVLRLLVPLLAGVFTFSIIQVYLERVSHGQFSGSFFAFLPHYFQGVYVEGGTGNFAWHGLHLWYLAFLFVFTLVLMPLFWWMRAGFGARVLRRVGDVLALPGAVLLLPLVTMVLVHVEDGSDLLQGTRAGGWSPLLYLWFFLAGFLIISHERVQARIVQMRWLFLALAVALVALPVLQQAKPDGHRDITAWSGIFALMGFAMKHLTASNHFLAYANEAVLPFYILHQNVLLWIGFFAVLWPVPDVVKYLVITATSFLTIMVLYEYVVRRFDVLRILFGMKPLRRRARPAAALVPERLPG